MVHCRFADATQEFCWVNLIGRCWRTWEKEPENTHTRYRNGREGIRFRRPSSSSSSSSSSSFVVVLSYCTLWILLQSYVQRRRWRRREWKIGRWWRCWYFFTGGWCCVDRPFDTFFPAEMRGSKGLESESYAALSYLRKKRWDRLPRPLCLPHFRSSCAPALASTPD